MPQATAAILDRLSSLADATRSRVLLLLDRRELTVGELCGVLQLPQSTVSRHLKALSEADWITARAEGTSHLYTMARGEGDAAAQRLWAIVRDQVGTTTAADNDRRRLRTTLSRRGSKSQAFFSSAAGQWERVRDELFADFHAGAFAALAEPTWVLGDLGCGTGSTSAALAPFVARIIAVDASPSMLQAARRRLEHTDNVDLRKGDVESLPIEDRTLDAATMILVLHHVPEPGRALAEAARVLKPGGRLILVDMLPHDREKYRQQMGHVWLGFSEEGIRRSLTDARFDHVRITALPPDSRAKGPALFVASASKPLTA